MVMILGLLSGAALRPLSWFVVATLIVAVVLGRWLGHLAKPDDANGLDQN